MLIDSVRQSSVSRFIWTESYFSGAELSIAKFSDVLKPSGEWLDTFWGRLNQGRRELAAMLGRDIDAAELARMLGLSGGTLTGWKQGAPPHRRNLNLLADFFKAAGLSRYTYVFLEHGIEVASEAGTRAETKVPPDTRAKGKRFKKPEQRKKEG